MARRLPSFVIAGLGALAAAVVTMALVIDRGDDDSTVVLDQPGAYQEPTIATNDDVSGRDLPSVELTALDGDPVESRDLLDGRPLVVNLWFATCQPCKREMPAIEAAHSQFADRVRFLGVNPQDSPETARRFADELGVTYEMLRDPNGNLTTATGVVTYPMTFFVAADGTIVSQVAGEMSADDIASGIEGILGP